MESTPLTSRLAAANTQRTTTRQTLEARGANAGGQSVSGIVVETTEAGTTIATENDGFVTIPRTNEDPENVTPIVGRTYQATLSTAGQSKLQLNSRSNPASGGVAGASSLIVATRAPTIDDRGRPEQPWWVDISPAPADGLFRADLYIWTGAVAGYAKVSGDATTGAYDGVRLDLSVGSSFAASGNEIVSWDTNSGDATSIWDTNNYHDPLDPTKITFPEAGVRYDIRLGMDFNTAEAAGTETDVSVSLLFYDSNDNFVAPFSVEFDRHYYTSGFAGVESGVFSDAWNFCHLAASAGDYFTVRVRWDTNTGLAAYGRDGNTRVTVNRLG